MKFRSPWIHGMLIIIAVTTALLFLPPPPPEIPELAPGEPFLWNRDGVWHDLEARFNTARKISCVDQYPMIRHAFDIMDGQLENLQTTILNPDDPEFGQFLDRFFHTAARVAACHDFTDRLLNTAARFREAVKRQSTQWNIAEKTARDTLYTCLYGTRAGVEEVLLQMDHPPELVPGTEEPSRTPWTTILGVRIHSGDILVSRGGAPTSALIARGNDYPGNFSHIALVYVDDTSHIGSIVEAHIECGVTISSLKQYLEDTKLRVMVLRPRHDLPELIQDPMLPHAAARTAFQRASSSHIPYDFAMDTRNDDAWFCSEVAASAYRSQGIDLWMGVSRISSPVLAAWLAGFGVRHLETQEPSDLEYDPQLTVVAEWRDRDTLFKDHVDNAVIDAMLETAASPDPLPYSHAKLPAARLAKLYSAIMNLFGRVSIIPEGMDAAAALRNKAFSARHAELKTALLESVVRFQSENGYPPPYWQIVAMAEDIASNR